MTPEQQAIIDEVRRKRVARGGANAAPSSMTDEQQQVIEAVRARRAAKEIPGVKRLKTKPAKGQPQFTLPMQEAMRMGPLVASQMMQSGAPLTQVNEPQPGSFVPSGSKLVGDAPLPGGGLPPDQNLPGGGPRAPNLTEQQQRLAEFARIARAPVGGPNIEAEKSHIGPMPADRLADESQAGNAIWQLQNKGGTYDPNYNMTPAERAADLYKSADTGIGQGVAGTGSLPSLVQQHLVPWLDQKITGNLMRWGGYSEDDIRKRDEAVRADVAGGTHLPTHEDMVAGMERINPGTMTYRPATRAGEYGRTIGQFVGSGVSGGGTASTLRNLAAVGRNTILPAVATQAATDLTGDERYGMAAGLLSPLALKAGTSGLGALISPGRATNPARENARRYLEGEGVRLTAGDITGSPTMKMAEEELGGSAFQTFKEGQKGDITQAATSVISHGRRNPMRTADDADLGRLDTAVSREFQTLGRRNVTRADRAFGGVLANVWNDYSSSNLQLVPRVAQTLNQLRALGSRAVPASQYQKMRSQVAAWGREAADPDLRRAYNGIRDAIDDVMERSIQATNPADLGRFRTARRDWHNLMTLKEAMSGASQDTNLGLVTPAMLAQAAKKTHGRTSVAMGRGDFAQLARATNALLRDLNNSRTAGRAAARTVPRTIGSALGTGGVGYMLGAQTTPFGSDPSVAGTGGALGGAALGALVPFLAGRALLSRPGRAWFSNQWGQGLRRAGQHQGWAFPLTSGALGVGALKYLPAPGAPAGTKAAEYLKAEDRR